MFYRRRSLICLPLSPPLHRLETQHWRQPCLPTGMEGLAVGEVWPQAGRISAHPWMTHPNRPEGRDNGQTLLSLCLCQSASSTTSRPHLYGRTDERTACEPERIRLLSNSDSRLCVFRPSLTTYVRGFQSGGQGPCGCAALLQGGHSKAYDYFLILSYLEFCRESVWEPEGGIWGCKKMKILGKNKQKKT